MSEHYLRLRAMLAQPPYTKMTDDEAAEALKAATIAVTGPIPARAVKRLWGQRMVLAAARIAADDPDVPRDLRILCRATYDNLMGDLFADLDPADPTQGPTIAAYLDGLQAAGVLSAEVRAETLALATAAVPVRQHIGWPNETIWPGDVAAARKMGG